MSDPIPMHQRPASFHKVFNPPLKFTFFLDSGEACEATVDHCTYNAPDPTALSKTERAGWTDLGLHCPKVSAYSGSPDEFNRLWNDALAAVDYYLDHLAELEGTPDPEQVPSNEQ